MAHTEISRKKRKLLQINVLDKHGRKKVSIRFFEWTGHVINCQIIYLRHMSLCRH